MDGRLLEVFFFSVWLLAACMIGLDTLSLSVLYLFLILWHHTVLQLF